MKVVVIGGVAGGASAASRARRLDESAEIVMFERGEYISFANCGLPYHVGDVIPQRESLLVMTPEKLTARTNIDVRVRQEIVAICPQKKEVSVHNLETDEKYTESYDKLILSPGSRAVKPPIPGADDSNVLVLWNMHDMDRIKARVDKGLKSAVIIGGGFIGIEVAENLRARGVQTSLVERLPQILSPFDGEMTQPLNATMHANGIALYLDNGVTSISRIHDTARTMRLTLKDDTVLDTDLVVMAVGVQPNSELAKGAGLLLNSRGGIVVNAQLQTSDPDIYAVGDVIEVKEPVLGGDTMIPLAGPANRQGRIAAENALGGVETYKGTIGTAICKVFELTAASTGVNERTLKAANVRYHKLYLGVESHASYYPGAALMNVKVLFASDGRILGAQIVGADGVDKRIDLLATAVKHELTLSDMEELELAYAPPYGSAKDPINFIGFVGQNLLKGDSTPVYADAMPVGAFLLDVRQPEEVSCGKIPTAVNIPVGEVRARLDELPKDKPIVTICKVGTRGYLVERILKQNGFDCSNLSGGYLAWKLFNPTPLESVTKWQATSPVEVSQSEVIELDACGLQCPGPIVSVKNKLDQMEAGQILQVTVTDLGFKGDLPAWCRSTGNELISIKDESGKVVASVRKSGEEAVVNSDEPVKKKTTLVLFSNDLDKAMAAFIIATGFASLGHEVNVFCTFWGLNVLRKDNPPAVKKDFLSKMFGWMMPRGPKKLALSKMHMMGMGTAMMKHVMNNKNVDDLPTLIQQARGMGVNLLACEMAMNVMGIQREELVDGIESVGVANFAALSEESGTTLFV